MCYSRRSRREVLKSCTLLRYYETSSGNFLPTFRDKQEALGRTMWRTRFGRGSESVVR